MKKTVAGSYYQGKLPEGCKRCIIGRKMVLFVTGLCPNDCYYCSISKKRWQRDIINANERKVKKIKDIIEEARVSGSTGAGITGGEPLVKMKRVIKYIKELKEEFGNGYHIHLYTSGIVPDVKKKIDMLYKAGLDELRIHLNKDLVKYARKYDWKIGMEIPVIPGKEKEIITLAKYLENVNADFLNLNELEFSERNIEPLEKRGYKLKEGSLTAVEGSEKTSLKVLKKTENLELNIHYCTASLKINFQLRNRLINRAKNIKKSFEIVTKDGFLKKGVIYGREKEILKELKKYKIKEYFWSGKRMEISVKDAIRISKNIPFKVAIVEEYPAHKRWDFEITPLNQRK